MFTLGFNPGSLTNILVGRVTYACGIVSLPSTVAHRCLKTTAQSLQQLNALAMSVAVDPTEICI
jgi:hypothetical protein